MELKRGVANDVPTLLIQETIERESPVEKEAAMIISEATRKAEEIITEIISKAEEQGQRILEEADDKAGEIMSNAELEALIVKYESDQLLTRSRQIVKNELREELAAAFQEVLSSPEFQASVETVKTTADAVSSDSLCKSENLKPLVVNRAQQQSVGELPHAEDRKDDGEMEKIIEGKVELILPPTTDLNGALKLVRYLRSTHKVKLIDTWTSKTKGISLNISLRRQVSLGQLIGDMPGIGKIRENKNPAIIQQPGKVSPMRSFTLTVR
jgi:vacuolar-type H+-ATPase subunit H